MTVVDEIRAALRDEGYGVSYSTIVQIREDPNGGNVWAVRVEAGVPEEFVVYLDDPEGDRVEEVEFQSWPPSSGHGVNFF